MSKPLSSGLLWFRLNKSMLHKHHIIPRHMGGSDDPTNLVELTPAEHAEAHRLLYEQHGHWQDYVAWQGLAKLDANFDAAKQAIIEGGRKGGQTNIRQRKGKKWEEIYGFERAAEIRAKHKGTRKNTGKTWQGKLYEITHPDGTVEQVEGLRQWCLDKGYNPNNFGNACLRGSVTNGGFRVKKLES
jgi:hypothetical protein